MKVKPGAISKFRLREIVRPLLPQPGNDREENAIGGGAEGIDTPITHPKVMLQIALASRWWRGKDEEE